MLSGAELSSVKAGGQNVIFFLLLRGYSLLRPTHIECRFLFSLGWLVTKASVVQQADKKWLRSVGCFYCLLVRAEISFSCYSSRV